MDNYSGTGNLGDGEEGRSSSNLVSGLATEHRLRLPGMGGMMLVSSTSPGKQQPRCRAASEMEVGVELDNFRSGRVGGPTKIARTDGYTPFVCREQKMQIQMDSASANASASDHHLPVLRNRSGSDNSSACLVSEGRPRLAPSSTNSYASSERSILNNDGSSSTVSSESRLLRSNDSVLSAIDARHSLRFYRPPAGMPVSSMAMGREFGVMETGMGIHGVRTGVRPPFSPAQWEELEHQALIFKYMMACIPVPPELIIPIRKSLHSLPERSPPLPPHHHLSTLTPWSSFHMGFGGNMDPEPGRCRRTDGKKWRCSRDVVPDQKYCERHMHRGRHRSRKPVEGHTAAVTSQSNSISAPSSLSLAAAVTTSSNVLARPSISVNSLQKLHQPGPLLGTKNLSFTGSGSQIQQYPLQAAAGAVTSSSPSAMGNKDYRYVNGMKGGEMDEHILFSEASGSSTITNQWRFTAASKAAVPYIPQSKTNNNDSLLQYSSSPQLRTLLGQNLGIVTEGNQVAGIHMNPPDKQQQQRRQQHSFLSTDYGRMQEAMREPEEQPLRHFFDEWPRSRNPWATDVEDETSNRNSSTTQLSISIPMPSSNFSATNSNSSPRGKLSLTSLKLSMSGDGSDPLGVDPIEMGLAVGMNMSVEDRHRQTQSQHHHHHQANWVPIAWGNPMGIGGPLAEVLQSSTTPSGCNKNKPGLNLMNDIGWKDNMNNSSSSNKNSTSSHSRDSPPSCMQTSSPAERGVAGRMGSAIDHPVSTHKGIGH